MLAKENITRLLIIRTGLLLGVLVFGAVTWYLRRQGSLEALDPARTATFGYAFMALTASALVGLFVLRAQVQRTTEAAKQVQLYIIGYALAEGAALFGGVIWYLGGVREWYIAGLVLMVVAFQVLPLKRVQP